MRICSLAMSSAVSRSGPRPTSFSISWAEWARAALDSIEGGYMENLHTAGRLVVSVYFGGKMSKNISVRFDKALKNGSIKMTRGAQIANKLSRFRYI